MWMGCYRDGHDRGTDREDAGMSQEWDMTGIQKGDNRMRHNRNTDETTEWDIMGVLMG